eukprot:COSAG02_NODE_78_length_40609_cov_19.893730_7_plen_42_part_00
MLAQRTHRIKTFGRKSIIVRASRDYIGFNSTTVHGSTDTVQ